MATKKISELPLVNRVSGSQVAGGSVLPIVIGGGVQGTTNQISVEDFSVFVNAYNATTGSNTFIGNQIVNGNVNVSGRLTVNELVAQYETSSILFSTGSTKLGDQLTDKHEFTGSTNITGSLIANGFVTLNGQSLNNSFDRIHQASQSLQAHSASVDNQLARVYQTTQSLHVATASLQAHSASVDSQLLRLQQTTQSLHVATASLNVFTASQDARNFIISEFTSSTNAHIVGISDFTSSQLTVNLGNSIYTASVDSHIVGISTYTSSVRDTLARVHQATQSLEQFTASQDSRNFVVSQVTGSLIGITNGLMAFTAALDNTYATDAQLYQLYQATRSIELHSGSMIGITNGLMAYTSSNETWKTGVRGEISAIEAWTASLDSTYATDAQLYQLYAETASMKGEIAGIEAYTASLKGAAIVSSSTQITNYYKFAETASANTFYGTQTVTGNIVGQADIQANKFVFTDGVINTNVGGQKIVATNSNILYLYTGTSGLYINNQANDTTIAKFTNAGELTIGGPGNDQNLVFGGTNSSIYWGVGGPARMYYSTGDIRISSNGAADVLNVKNIGGILVNGGITGSLMATNGVVSGSQQIAEYNRFAQTSSANTFYGIQTISGSINANGGITGSFKGNLDGVAAYTSLIAVTNTGTTTDTSLYPTFTTSPVLGSYSNLYSHASSSFFLNGVTRRLHMEGFVVSGSNNIAEISGSLNVVGNTVLSGSINISGSTTFTGVHTLNGTNTIIGNTIMSGSIEVSGSSNFKNSLFILTGSSFFTGSHDVKGNTSVTGSLHVTGQTILSGSINIASGSGFYRAGNKLFNYGQFLNTQTQSGSANTAYGIQFNTLDFADGINITNDISGLPTRITVTNTGVYNIQFSSQLATTATESCDFTIWLVKNGTAVANSAGEVGVIKDAGGGKTLAAWNYLVQLNAGEYAELYYSKTTANGQIQYVGTQSTPTRPAGASTIVTITQVA